MQLRNPTSGAPTLLHQGEGHMVGGARRESPNGPAESKTLCMRRHPMHENREVPLASAGPLILRIGQGRSVATILTCTPAGSQTSA